MKGLLGATLLTISLAIIINLTYCQNRQLQVLKLFNVLASCVHKEDADVVQLSNEFSPLDHLQSYKNPTIVNHTVQELKAGRLPGRNSSSSTGSAIRFLFEIFYFIDDWDLFYKTAAYFVMRVDGEQFAWTLSVLLNSKYYGQFKLPPWYEIFPQAYAPKATIYELEGKTAPNQPNIKVNNKYQEKLWYFLNDAEMANFHTYWHIIWPPWWDPQRYGYIKRRKGGLFMYMHHNMVNRYIAECVTNGLERPHVLRPDPQWVLQEGILPPILLTNFKEYAIRSPKTHLTKEALTNITLWHDRIRKSINDGYVVTKDTKPLSLRAKTPEEEVGTDDIVGAIIEASLDSIDLPFYGNIHNALHTAWATVVDRTVDSYYGIILAIQTSVKDTLFYNLHSFIDDMFRQYRYHLTPYEAKDMEFKGVHLVKVDIVTKLWPPFFGHFPVLTTFFDDYSIDLRHAVRNCSRVGSDETSFPTPVKRLNYHTFSYRLQIQANVGQSTPAEVRVFLSPIFDHNRKPFTKEDLFWQMFELDRFPILLQPGGNLRNILRDSKDSSVTLPNTQSLRELLKEAQDNNTAKGPVGPCGFPQHLLLPKGSKLGSWFKMFVIITKSSNGKLEEFPGISLCGYGGQEAFEDNNLPLGFPFDRRIKQDLFSLGPVVVPGITNYQMFDVIIKHTS